MRFGGIKILAGAGLFAASLSRAETPRLKMPESDLIPNCLRNSTADAQGGLVAQANWELACPLSDLQSRMQSSPPANPALRLVVGRVLHGEIRKVRAEVVREFIEKPRETALFENKLFNAFQDLFSPPSLLPPSPPFESTEGAVLTHTQSYVETAGDVLRPLFSNSPLSSEAVREYLEILGDSFRFAAAAEHIEKNWPLIQPIANAREVLQEISKWVDVYGALPLRPWLLTRLEAARPSEITGMRPEQLDYWLKSLELDGTNRLAREEILRKLRALWVNYPSAAQTQRIRATAEKIGLGKEFQPPDLRDMNFDEILARAQAQVRGLDGSGALRTLKRVLALPRNEVDADKLWSALQIHARVLRITDQRHLIPDLLASYVKAGHFAEAPKPEKKKPSKQYQEQLAKFLSRGVDISRMAWSYDTPDKAQDYVDRYLKIARSSKPIQEGVIAQLLYLRARMAEQGKDRLKAKAAFAEAVAARPPLDLLTDLLWRNLHLSFDLVRDRQLPPSQLLSQFEPLKKTLQDNVDRSRWNYWQAQALLLNARTPADEKNPQVAQALEYFDKAYKIEPYSFYSNLAGLELIQRGRKPKDWVLASEHSYAVPRWGDFFSVSGDDYGQAKIPAYRDLVRVYLLASIGDFKGAAVAAHELDGAIWDRVLSSRSPIKDRRKYVRAIAWLRIAMQDPMGSLKAAEVARQAYGPEFEPEDFLYLYPLPYWEGIQTEADTRGVNPWLAASLIRQESAFNPHAKSGANALGLMQMIPSVANAEARSLGLKDFNVQDLYEPSVALKLGVYHLSKRVNEMGGSWICATAAYNAGTPPVYKWLGNYDTTSPVAFIERISFQETRNYVRAILRNYMNYRRIYAGGTFDLSTIVKMPKRSPSGGDGKATDEVEAKTTQTANRS